MKKTLRRFQFVQVDVFASTPLEGNPLAVFPDARGLEDDQMQAIARETNLSETTFIFRRDPLVEAESGVKVRIFTVQEELPFAGHPTLGTAFAIRGESGASEVALDLKVGKIPVRFEDEPGKPAFGEMTQRNPEFVAQHSREDIARATGVNADDFDPQLPIQTVSTGIPFTIVPLRSLKAARNLQLNLATASQYAERTGAGFFYFVCRESVDPDARLHARMIFYNGEDPATGSAAGCCTAWAVAHGVAKPDERFLIEQGVEKKRPSRIFGRASKDVNKVVNVRVGGNAVEVLRGEYFF